MSNISSWTDLNNIRNAKSGTYVLTRDLLSTDGDYAGIGSNFVPIGTDDEFKGSFDGQGFKIYNLIINQSITEVGLFGVSSGTISNLGLIDANVIGLNDTGVLVGLNLGTITNCYSTGTVSGVYGVGGLVGFNSLVINKCYSEVNVSSTGQSGGLVGCSNGSSAHINNCYSKGNVSTSGNYYCGGFCGYNYSAYIDNCYSTGHITGTGIYVGGFIGRDRTAFTTDSFWDKETSGKTTSSAGIGKTTVEMKTLSTFTNAGWDFSVIPIWYFYENEYPNFLPPPPPETIEIDIINLSDEINLNVSREKLDLQDIIILNEDSNLLHQQETVENLSIFDEIELDVSREKVEISDTLSLSDAIILQLQETYDLVNDFHLVRQVTSDVNNKFNFVRQVLTDINNFCNTVYLRISDIGQKINSKKQSVYDIGNDIRTLLSFQIPGIAGVQSLGKSYIKVYINNVLQEDVDIDSIVITKSLDGAHTASFELGRAYDITKPALELPVEIKYHIWTLYRGYVTQIVPTDSPENIKIQCQDEYWKKNQDKVYFNVGHRPSSDNDLYYNTVASGLSACGVSFGIGGFIPQVVGLFGTPQSDAISGLVNEAGNFSWYYNPGGIASLWQAGEGDIVNIERQEIGKNIGLYQVLSHQIKEDAESLVNKFRVQMGQQVIKRFSSTGASQSYKSYETMNFPFNPSPNWDTGYEVLAKNSGSGYGWDYHPTSQDAFYAKVFKEYSMSNYIAGIAGVFEGWSDEFAPKVEVTSGGWEMNVPSGRMTSGFTIDYDNNLLVFSEPIFCVQKNQYGEVTAIRRPNVYVCLYKKKYYTNTTDPSSNPQTDITNPLMFFTSVMGTYPVTIMNNLSLTNLGIQVGGWYKDTETTYKLVPSWNDTGFAQDYANWQLSKGCDVKYSGNIEITLDAFCYYAIELNKRIMINGVLDNPLNIESISLNVSSFTASISLQSGRYFARTVSIQSRGE